MDILTQKGLKSMDYETRTGNALVRRFKRVKAAVLKFIGYLNTIKRENRSGVTDDDEIGLAMKLYEEKETKKEDKEQKSFPSWITGNIWSPGIL